MAEENKEITPMAEEKQEFISLTNKLHNVVDMLEDKTKYTSLLELFNLGKLHIITRLDKSKVDEITKFETLAESQKLLYGLNDQADGILIINKMCDAYRKNNISRNGKSRAEVVEVLKDSYGETQRDNWKRLTGTK